MTKFKNYWPLLIIILALIGLIDATYLTVEHYQNVIPPCTTALINSDCGKVLRSTYSVIFGVPLALVGLVHYFLETIVLSTAVIQNNVKAKRLAVVLASIGLLSSIYFVYLQFVVIGAICLFCMGSALISTLIFILVFVAFSEQRKYLTIYISHFLYKNIVKKLLFELDPEIVHEGMTNFGQVLGSNWIAKNTTSWMFKTTNSTLSQKIADINFNNPIGLAAGFDYEAKLTQILPSLGFGFETVGTITNYPYSGNPRPRLGRLPKSQSLMVNKGFKNLGAKETVKKLKKLRFDFPLGISIGKTNVLNLKTQKQSIKDIVSAFKIFEKTKVKNSYYELNISCPNLKGNITFYPPKNLDDLLKEIDKLKISKPLFIKMPIEKSDKEILGMLRVISKHSPAGVVVGNLQKDRANKALVKSELANFPVGNFSGKPTWKDSNRLISLAYRKYKKRFIIIGCGGVFSAKDAYTKIKLGASLVQLITGMIYEGPQLIAEINLKLPELLKKDGFQTISEAVGSSTH